jgi:hypothetical protein
MICMNLAIRVAIRLIRTHMKIIPFVLLALVTLPLHAQDNYVVTVKNDTLRGSIQILSYDLMDRVSIKTKGKKTNLTAIETRLVFLDSASYAPVQFENTIRFMRIIRPGYLTLYGYRKENQNSYDNRLLAKLNGQKLDLPNLGFKKILSEFLSDCFSTSQKIKSGDFERSKIEAVVDDYNACVAEQNKLAASTVTSSPLIEAVAALRTKVENSAIDSKKDVLDLLADIDGKAKNNQTIPSYLSGGLKGYLADKKEFEVELNNVLSLIK